MIQQGNIRFFIPPDQIEMEALKQVRNTASMPFVHGVAVMPDCHFGMGSTVGTVVATEGAVMPACVGVDIGCGMIAVRTSLTVEQVMPHLRTIREGIERCIPVGIGAHGRNSRVLFGTTSRAVQQLWDLSNHLFGDETHMRDRFQDWELQLGSLGGGNHFIELCVGHELHWCGNCEEQKPEEVWVILHSGSRAVGNKTGNHWTRVAKSLYKHYMNGVQIPDPNLAALIEGTIEYTEYMKELRWCQEFARLNREEMMDRVLLELSYTVTQREDNGIHWDHPSMFEVERINSHHNYAVEEEHEGKKLLITRKGAILASAGKRSLIPGSMGTNSYIVEGLGHPASFDSAPHGAGRRMSRTKAKEMFTVEMVAAQMAERGIECRMREAIVDEAPGAYKDIEQTMYHAAELIRPLYQLRQIVNIKGD